MLPQIRNLCTPLCIPSIFLENFASFGSSSHMAQWVACLPVFTGSFMSLGWWVNVWAFLPSLNQGRRNRSMHMNDSSRNLYWTFVNFSYTVMNFSYTVINLHGLILVWYLYLRHLCMHNRVASILVAWETAIQKRICLLGGCLSSWLQSQQFKCTHAP